MAEHSLPPGGKSFFAARYIQTIDNDVIMVFGNERQAKNAYHQARFFAADVKILYLPSFDTIPYDRVSPSQQLISERAGILSNLASCSRQKLLITSAVNLAVKLPPPARLAEKVQRLYAGMKLTTQQLSILLAASGFSRSASATESGEFAARGEIVDLVLPDDQAFRINFNWEQIESIKKYDIDSQISHSSQPSLVLNLASEIVLSPTTISSFKTHYLQNFGVNHTDAAIYHAVIEGRKFPGYENLLPLFYGQLSLLVDYLNSPVIIHDYLGLQSILEHEYSYQDLYQARTQANKINLSTFYPALPPSQLYASTRQIKDILAGELNILIKPGGAEQNYAALPALDSGAKLSELIASNLAAGWIIIIFCHSSSALERLKSLVAYHKYQYAEITTLLEAKINLINFTKITLDDGFYVDNYLFISEYNIFGDKSTGIHLPSSKRRLKNILTELDNLSAGDLVVHKDHGIGRFLTAEIVEVRGQPHDCLKILYAGNDKLYIPVENIEVIKKYGNFEAELDKLGSIAWQKRKSRVKNRITSIAENLLQLSARRKIASIEPIVFDSAAYDQFCRRFHYAETEDQLKSIEEVRLDLTSGLLMDRLICGDVGFGKTEIAMRAAYMVAASSQAVTPQVVIIAPTTILCKQHYSRFLARFSNLGFNIVQLSRLVKPKDGQKVKQQIKDGTAQIIIGTHALLAKTIEFHNVRLLIIDEEQHFGVGQKECLKALKSDIHLLSLSATPIPRTLQMSLVGLKDLSLIATPPVDRLAVHTTVMPFDPVIIRDALLKEHFRGGRSFYVVPHISDIQEIENSLTSIVPELKFKTAHGRMLPALVDKIMTEFDDGKFDILLSTTIIESGIDIPAANTMIIHHANKLGLSQLYQLKGRIGRSKFRGYAYLTLASNKPVTKHSIKRLEIIQNANSLGSGFTIASHDMDLRGFGNLVGEEQSGQIREVGVELYQEMLDEQIAALQNQPASQIKTFVPVINLGLSILIPESYIADLSLKLGIYRRIGTLLTNQEVENFKDEMIDRFGPMPVEFDNLLSTVKVKQICHSLNIQNFDSGDQGFVLKFYHHHNNADLIMKFVNKYPGQAKIRPDNKLIFIRSLKNTNIIDEATKLLSNLTAS